MSSGCTLTLKSLIAQHCVMQLNLAEKRAGESGFMIHARLYENSHSVDTRYVFLFANRFEIANSSTYLHFVYPHQLLIIGSSANLKLFRIRCSTTCPQLFWTLRMKAIPGGSRTNLVRSFSILFYFMLIAAVCEWLLVPLCFLLHCRVFDHFIRRGAGRNWPHDVLVVVG